MPCPTSDTLDLRPWDAACYSVNVTRSHDSAYLQASEECCFAIAGTHLIIDDEDCWAYCNVSTKYEGIAVGTCGNNGLNLPDDVDTSHIGGMCTYGDLPEGEDIRSLIPTSLLGSYAHPDPTDSNSNSGSATPTAGGAAETTTRTEQVVPTTTTTWTSRLPSSTLTGDTSTTESPSKSITKADAVASTSESSKTGISTPLASAPAASSAPVSKGTSTRMPKIALGLVAFSLGTMLLQS